MSKEFLEKLKSSYPKLYKNLTYISCTKGWFPLIETLSSTVEQKISYLPDEIKEDVYAVQVKEKFGTLRFYMNHETPFIDGAITMAENMSGIICEECGMPGTRRSGNWIRTLCNKCDKKRDKK